LTPRRLLGAVGLSVLVALGVVGAASSPALAAPAATVEPSAVAVGAPVIVRGSGFDPGSLVSVEVCGNEGRRGSADCDQSTSLDTGVSSSGELAVQLSVGTPPSPCPCVVKLTSLSSSASATAPISVIGAPTADAATLAQQYPDVNRQLAVNNPHFEGEGPWTAWFGGSPHRDLVYTVQNTGNVTVEDPPIIVALGKGSDPTGIVHPPPVGVLQPGESRTYHVPVDLGVLAFGHYQAVGKIPGFANPVEFRASTSTYPWALLLLIVVGAFEFVLIKARNRARARLARQAEVAPALVGAMAALNPAPVLVARAAGTSPGPTANADELEEAIVAALSETLASTHAALGDRHLSDAEATRLAAALADEVATAVAETLGLSAEDRAVVASHLERELDRVLSGDRPEERQLATAGHAGAR
jgi:hypothetical protein